ncbi:hypothetical protein GPECTOR_240g573 [Gonium pectorale]|uniref:Uncharacterized protein n=1 Tax=Gonium pectorale TaxID=33097 RepID=A0A150FWE6_GONPE|nr:hypothetical protein GPECTOR_240g573 [Gonium pectorale]|eukprot:KXZ41931.1 hypothetical protein GPECTOR_240g573 [Gonium pectorale]
MLLRPVDETRDYKLSFDRQQRAALVAVAVAPPPGLHFRSKDTLPHYADLPFVDTRLPLRMLTHLAESMNSAAAAAGTAATVGCAGGGSAAAAAASAAEAEAEAAPAAMVAAAAAGIGGGASAASCPVTCHAIKLHGGAWQRSRRLHFKGYVAVGEYLGLLERLGLQAAPREEYEARHSFDLQWLRSEGLTQLLHNGREVHLQPQHQPQRQPQSEGGRPQGQPRPQRAGAAQWEGDHAAAAALEPRGARAGAGAWCGADPAPAEAEADAEAQEGSNVRGPGAQADAQAEAGGEENAEAAPAAAPTAGVTWYGSRHAPLLLAVPSGGRPLNGLTAAEALAAATAFVRRYHDPRADWDEAQGFCLMLIPLTVQSALLAASAAAAAAAPCAVANAGAIRAGPACAASAHAPAV